MPGSRTPPPPRTISPPRSPAQVLLTGDRIQASGQILTRIGGRKVVQRPNKDMARESHRRHQPQRPRVVPRPPRRSPPPATAGFVRGREEVDEPPAGVQARENLPRLTTGQIFGPDTVSFMHAQKQRARVHAREKLPRLARYFKYVSFGVHHCPSFDRRRST